MSYSDLCLSDDVAKAMSSTELKERRDAAYDKLKSLQFLLDEGRAIGNAEAYVSRQDVLRAADEYHAASTDYSCWGRV